MRTGKLVLGTFAGLAAGALAGILFAPEKGTLTRKQIIEKGDEYRIKLKSRANKFSETLSEKLKRTKKHADEMVGKEKAKFEEIQNAAEKATENLKKDISEEIGPFS